MKALPCIITVLSLLSTFSLPSVAKSTAMVTDKSTTSYIEVINDYNNDLEIKLTRNYQAGANPSCVTKQKSALLDKNNLVTIKQAPVNTAKIPVKQKSPLLDVGNIPNSCFTLGVKGNDGKWHNFTCVLEFPNIPPYKTEVMCETDVGGDMYVSASGHQIQVHYITPNDNTNNN